MMILPDFKDRDGQWVARVRVNGTECKTLAGSTWGSMMTRADPNSARQKNSPSYRGVTASSEFSNFQSFCEWYTSQVGYAEGYALDKDFLFPGNKEYRPDRCALIPTFLNNFCQDRVDQKGTGLPRGVHRSKCKKISYHVLITCLRNYDYVGSYDTVIEAAEAYRIAKVKLAKKIACDFIGSGTPMDQRVLDKLMNWEMPIFNLAKKGGTQ